MVILTGHNTGDGGLQGDWTEALAAAPQLLIPLVTIAEIAHHSRKALQFSGRILERHRNGIRPESRPIFFDLPAFGAHMTFGCDPIELLLHFGRRTTFARIKKRYVLANRLIGLIAVNARRSRIPGGKTSPSIQKVE